jgi:hypothetical protein
MAIEDTTKKASVRILKELAKLNDKVSARTTYQQAFDILMEHWDLELSLVNDKETTTCCIYRDGTIVYTFDWKKSEVYDIKDCDWDWSYVYKLVLEQCIKDKLYKRPKISKRELNRIAKEKAEAEKAAAKAAAKTTKDEAKPKRKKKTV